MTFQVGDKVRVKAVASNREELRNEKGTIVKVYDGRDEVEVHFGIELCGYPATFEWFFYESSARLEVIGNVPTIPTLSEGPCRQCGKKNDLTVKSCWWCECAPF